MKLMSRSILSSGDRWGKSPLCIVFQGCLNIFEAAFQINDEYLTNHPDVQYRYESNWIDYLESCPDLLLYRDDHGNSLLHHLCSFYIEDTLPRQLLVIVLRMTSSSIIYCKNSDGHNVADVAAVYSPLEIILLVLNYTSSFQSLVNPLSNGALMYFYENGNKKQVLEKLIFFVERDWSIIRMRQSTNHLTPLHFWLDINRNGRDHMPKKFFYFCEALITLDPECCKDIRRFYHPQCENSVLDLPKDDRLPLVVLMQRDDFRWECQRSNTMSMYYQLFRTILHAFPNAANTKCWTSRIRNNLIFNKKLYQTPYEYGVGMKMSSVYLRLMLNALPDIDDVQMRQYNFAARKSSLMLGCWKGLITTSSILNIFCVVRFANIEIFKKIVFYL